MSPEAKGVYIDFLAWSWDNGALPTKEAELAVLAGVSLRRFHPIWLALKSKWKHTEAGYVNPRLEDQRKELARYREQQAEKGRRSAQARTGNRCSTAVQPRLDSGWPSGSNQTPNREATLQTADCDLQSADPKSVRTDRAPTRELLAEFDRVHQAYFHGVKAVIHAGKDASLIAKLWQSHGSDVVIALIADFFASRDPFIRDAGYTVGVFVSQAGKLLTRRIQQPRTAVPDLAWEDECRELHGSRCGNRHMHAAKMDEARAS